MSPPSRKTVLSSLGASLLAACSPLTTFNTLTPKDPALRQARGIAFGDEPRHRLDVYAPRRGAREAPVLVFFYGGGWDSGRRQDYVFAGHALAAQGFLTIVPDYGLFPQVRYPDFLHDGALAIRWASRNAARFGGDPTRLLLAGHSAGAYNAVMLGLNSGLTEAVGVDPSHIRAMAGLSGPYNFLPLDVPATINAFGHYPDLPATQPFNYARPDAPATFLAWGDKDTVVGPQNIAALAPALKAQGVKVETKIYPDVDHPGLVLALSRPFRGKAPVLADMSRFLMANAG